MSKPHAKHPGGRPREYKDGVKRLSTTVPVPLLREFEEAWQRLNGGDGANVSRGVQDALRLWLSVRASGSSDVAAIFVDLPAVQRRKILRLASQRKKTPAALAGEIIEAFLETFPDGHIEEATAVMRVAAGTKMRYNGP